MKKREYFTRNLEVEFAVLTVFDIVFSNNHNFWKSIVLIIDPLKFSVALTYIYYFAYQRSAKANVRKLKLYGTLEPNPPRLPPPPPPPSSRKKALKSQLYCKM